MMRFVGDGGDFFFAAAHKSPEFRASFGRVDTE